MFAEPGALASERTWRPSLSYRLSLILIQALLMTVPTAYLWLTLWTNQVKNAGWLVVPCIPACRAELDRFRSR